MKINIKNFVYILLVLVAGLTSCHETGKQAEDAHIEKYRLGDFEFSLPKAEQWKAAKIMGGHILLQFDQNPDSANSTIDAELIPLPGSVNEAIVFKVLEDSIANRFSHLKCISPHYNVKSYKGQKCLEYDGIYQDTTKAKAEYLSCKGWIVQNPGNQKEFGHLKLTHVSRERGIPDSLLTYYENLVESSGFKH